MGNFAAKKHGFSDSIAQTIVEDLQRWPENPDDRVCIFPIFAPDFFELLTFNPAKFWI
jgi:hypothetical protein